MSLPLSTTLPRAALVTGAARRIGRALALELGRLGFAVAVHCHRSRQEADGVAAEIAAAGGKAVVIAADLSRGSATAAVIPHARAALGPLGVLGNNASGVERDGALP